MALDSLHTHHDPLRVPRGLTAAYHHAGGGAWGVYEAANLANPIYHLLTTGDACLQANRGTIDVHAASRACTHAATTTASTLTATTGATAATRGLSARLPSTTPHTAGNAPAGTPAGRSGLSGELSVTSRNSPATIGGREYTGHALDRMQGRGLVPSVVEDAVAHGQRIPSRGGTSIFYSADNNISVVLSSDGRVVTVGYGRLKP